MIEPDEDSDTDSLSPIPSTLPLSAKMEPGTQKTLRRNKQGSLTAAQIQKKLTKKNSVYFNMQDYNPEEKKTDLRTLAHNRMEKENTLKKQQGKDYKPKKSVFKKNSIYVEGTLEHKLSSLMDLAYQDLENVQVIVDPKEAEKKRLAKNKEFQKYVEMKSGNNYGKLKEQCVVQAREEVEKFYLDVEFELDGIERELGIYDEELIKEIKKNEMIIPITRTATMLSKESAQSVATTGSGNVEEVNEVDELNATEDGFGVKYVEREIVNEKGIVEKVIEKVTEVANYYLGDV